jgi:hypothetical protein
MSTSTASGVTQITGLSPQFLVDDLPIAIEYYRDKLGFAPDFVYESFTRVSAGTASRYI